MPNTNLIASSGTKEGILELLAEYLFSDVSNYRLDKQPDGTYHVFSLHRNKVLDSMVVIQRKKRWRLEYRK